MADGVAAETVEGGATLDTRKKWFQSSQDSTENARRLSEQDRDYYDHKQWSSDELSKLKARNQPPIVINRIQRKVDTIIGIEERSQTDPIGKPRTPNDEQAGEVVTDVLRFVADQNRFQRIKSLVLENLSIEGLGGAEITVEKRNGQPEVVINRLRWEHIFVDPHSREKDCSDARYKGTAKWLHIDDVEALYGAEAKKVADDALNSTALVSGSFDDRPTLFKSWCDRRGQRVVVVDMYYRHKGAWNRSIFCSGGDLMPDGPSPYLDEDGKPTCCLELASLYINRDNERYGLVRAMIGPQDEINFRRSKLLHLTSVRQTFANKGAGADVDKIKSELSRPDGHAEFNSGKWGEDFGVIQTSDMARGQAELLAEAKAEIDMLGPNNSLQGRGSDEQSGKAWQAQQQAGMAELAMLYASLNDWSLRVYKQIWQRVRQYWDGPRYVRVTDNQDAYKFTAVNEPIVNDAGQPVIDPRTGQPAMKNRPAQMNVDIIIDSAPDVTSMMDEQFQMLVKLRELGEPIPATAIIQASSLRNKRQILDDIKQAQAQPPQPDPVEVEKLKQGGEKLRQTGAQTEATVRKTNAEALQTELNIAVQAHQPMPVPEQQTRFIQ